MHGCAEICNLFRVLKTILLTGERSELQVVPLSDLII
jgi:hypothetical protein